MDPGPSYRHAHADIHAHTDIHAIHYSHSHANTNQHSHANGHSHAHIHANGDTIQTLPAHNHEELRFLTLDPNNITIDEEYMYRSALIRPYPDPLPIGRHFNTTVLVGMQDVLLPYLVP